MLGHLILPLSLSGWQTVPDVHICGWPKSPKSIWPGTRNGPDCNQSPSAEQLCSSALRIMPAMVTNIVCKMPWVQTEPLEKMQLGLRFTSCPEHSWICFYLEASVSQTGFLHPSQGPAPSYGQAPGTAEGAAFRTAVTQYWPFAQNPWCKSQAWLELARGKMSYHFPNDLELNTISLTKVLMQMGPSISLTWFVKLPYTNQF